MPAKWLSSSSDVPRRVNDALEEALRTLAQPAHARRLRQALLLLLALWVIVALSRLIWTLVPAGDVSLPEDTVVINPVSRPVAGSTSDTVNIDRMQAWHLFGEVGADIVAAEPEPAARDTARDGIEKGAKETRLDLTLRGVVASSEDGLGHAIIEYKSRQAVYAVDDKLPVPGQVVLAKVMPGQVVLDNGGTYELLELFGDSALDAQQGARKGPSRPAPKSAAASPPAAEISADGSASTLAQAYRERLYQNPQSLAEVVTVSAVRQDGQLLGYRIAPGKEPEQFQQLGFKPGDLVTSVNGIALDDPANTVRLYQAMRTAGEAVFDLQRDEQQLTVSVSLGAGSAEQ